MSELQEHHSNPVSVKRAPPLPLFPLNYDEEEDLTLEQRQVMFGAYEESMRSIGEGEIVRGTVLSIDDKDVLVDVGFKSEGIISLSEFSDPSSIKVGDILEVFLEKMENQDGLVVLSKQRADFVRVWDRVKEAHDSGQVVDGRLIRKIKGGVVVDLGGIDGLLHITDMSWGRVAHPSELVKIGDRVRVKVLNFDPEKERISLGLKQLDAYPWEGVEEKYKVGDRIKGRVVSITDYGAFIELEKGIEGLIHVSEMSWTRHVRHPSKIVNIGDIIEAVVLKVDKANEKISLGLKQVEPDPWLTLDHKYPPGMKVKGKVRNLTNFGAFVELEEGIDGLVHVSDMSWTKRVAHPSEVLKKGDAIDVVVLSIDKEHHRIGLGLKQVSDDPWPLLADRFPSGMELSGTINRLFDRGAIVDLGEGIEGFIPLSQLGLDDLKRPNDAFEVGEPLSMKVTRVDVPNHRLILSVKAWLGDQDDIALAEWTSKRNQVRARIAANPPVEESVPSKVREDVVDEE